MVTERGRAILSDLARVISHCIQVFETQGFGNFVYWGILCSIALIAFWKIGNFDVKADSTIFYWMPFRVFEFMMGAIALLIFARVQNFGSNKANLFLQNLLAILGTTLMLGAMIIPTFTGEPFGPISGFIACLGAVFVILVPKAFLSSSLFEFRPFRWIGQISYSLYLVHWPILIFLPETFQHQSGIWVGLIALSIILTIPIHYLIENPLRRGKLNDIFRFRPDGDLKLGSCLFDWLRIGSKSLYAMKNRYSKGSHLSERKIGGCSLLCR